jgi:hypothetical protein
MECLEVLTGIFPHQPVVWWSEICLHYLSVHVSSYQATVTSITSHQTLEY